MPSNRTWTLMWAAIQALLTTAVVAATGLAMIEFGFIDDSPLVNRAIPVPGGVLGVIVFSWRRQRDESGPG